MDVQAVRYAESITIHVELQPDQSDGLIYPPYVSVKYGVATADDYLANKNVTVIPSMLLVAMLVVQGSCRSGTVLEFKSHIFQAWKVLESGLGPGKSWKCE